MYHLYEKSKGIREIDKSEEEEDIIDTLGTYMGLLDTIDYLVVNKTKEQDFVVAVIKSYEDYIDYKYGKEAKEAVKVKRKSFYKSNIN